MALEKFKRIKGTNMCTYQTTDALSVVMGTGYFNNVAPDALVVGDIIHCAIDTDGSIENVTIVVSDVTSGVVTALEEPRLSQELTVSGAVTPGMKSAELNHATVIVAATIADAANHAGLLVVKDTSASGTGAHTLTLTAGTFNGTNNVATLNAPKECLTVWFDSAGAGTILENVGTVALS